MTAPPRLFLDASVLIAAAESRTGASTLVLEVCRHGQAKAMSTRLVLLEAERNIRAKLGREALLRFYREIGDLDLDLVDTPSPKEIADMSRIIHPKDAHVLAAAVKGDAEVLLTLDRAHFLSRTVLEAGLPFEIMTPGDFLRRWVER
ncbi:MAG: PIN domain-containing protein [Armatimonadota bacterium]|nr:PIN domain-containing protein [Armatimonadota bacterium]